MSSTTEHRPYFEKHIKRHQHPDTADFKEVSAIASAVARAMHPAWDYELPLWVRMTITRRLSEQQQSWVLRDALALYSQWGMDPRRNDPNYPLD